MQRAWLCLLDNLLVATGWLLSGPLRAFPSAGWRRLISSTSPQSTGAPEPPAPFWWPSLNSPQFCKVLSVPFSCWGSLKLYTEFFCSTYTSYLFPPYPSVNNLAELLLSLQHHSEEMTEAVVFWLHKWPSIHIPEVYHIKVDITRACLTNFQYFQWKSRRRRAEFSSLL